MPRDSSASPTRWPPRRSTGLASSIKAFRLMESSLAWAGRDRNNGRQPTSVPATRSAGCGKDDDGRRAAAGVAGRPARNGAGRGGVGLDGGLHPSPKRVGDQSPGRIYRGGRTASLTRWTSVVRIGQVLSVAQSLAESPKNVGTQPYIESVFENDLVELDAAGTLTAAEDNEHILITAESRRLHIAAHWADLHPGDALTQGRIPGTQHPVRLGGDGTPTIADFAPAELGCVLRISDGAASRLIGDALDLRHRLPKIWAAAVAGQAPAHQARHIATATRHLTKDQAGFVDAPIASALGAVSWNRLHTLLVAAIYQADPVGTEQRAALAAQERFVRLGRNSEYGLKIIIARATAGDAIWFKATIDRIADMLARQGDDDPADVRRSKAIGILAQPAQALQLLCQHQDEDWDGPEEPADLADEPDLDQNDPDKTPKAENADT